MTPSVSEGPVPLETRGFACIELKGASPPRQKIACRRPFGQPVRALRDLAEAVTEFTSARAKSFDARITIPAA